MTVVDMADRCTQLVRYAFKACPRPMRSQLEQFLDQINPLILTWLKQAQKSERNAIVALLERAGHLEAATMVRGQS